MKDFLSKLSSYNLFNYLLPGIVFVVLSEELTHYSLVQDDIVIGVFLYYFVGLVISRVGSLAIEPLLKRVSFLQFAEYKKFVAACKEDETIELLSEVNNTYRTLSSMFLLLLLLKLYEWVESRMPVFKDWRAIVLVVVQTLLFLFAYRKQTSYITKRVKNQADE